MGHAQYLYRLQLIDSQLDEAKQILAKLAANIGKSKALIKAEQMAEVVAKTLRQAQTHYQNLELEVKSLADKIAAEEKRLYGGKNVNPKEATNLQKEVAALKRHHVQQEELLLEALIAVEAAEAQVAEAQTALAQAQATAQGEQEKLQQLQIQYQQKIAQLTTQRPDVIASIQPAEVEEYNRLRVKKAGVAVVLVKDGACQGCNVGMSSSKAQRVRADDELVYCGTCGRILHSV